MTAGIILISLAVYIAVLFIIAQRGETRATDDAPRIRSLLYALSLTVYATSWTYFAAVGEAANDGWSMIGFYVGPMLAMTLFARAWRRVAAAAKREKSGSIADFLASRYGRSRALGAMVTAVALIAALPHIALQLNALTIGWNLIATGVPHSSTSMLVLMAVLLLVFAILFGARRADLTAQNRGLLRAIGVQAVVKIVALATVGIFAFFLIRGQPLPAHAQAEAERLATLPELDGRLFSMTLLGFTAMFCFPKQFHVGFVQLRVVEDIRAARWILPVYLAVAAIAIVPVVLAGAAQLPLALHDPALYTLSLPLAQGSTLLLALVTIGGFSAAASMVVLETIALAAMVSNELILPWITWRTQRNHPHEANFLTIILWVRRTTMLVLLGAACLFVILNRSDALRTIGIASFAASAQLFPLLIGAVYWQRASIWGAMAGLSGGMAAWAWAGFKLGVTGTLNPDYTALDSLTYTIVTSLSINVALFVLVSLAMPVRMIDRVTARSFVHGLDPRPRSGASPVLRARVDDLSRLVAHFLGEDGAREGFDQFGRESGHLLRPEDRVTPELAHAAERMLAGFIGSSSARSVIAVALAGPFGARSDILDFLDNAMGAVEFNRGVLQSALDSLPQGVCVLGRDRRLIAWNNEFLSIFALPDGITALDRPWDGVADVIAKSCQNHGPSLRELGLGAEQTDLLMADGRAISATWSPMTGDGLVLSFADVTEDRAREAELRRAASALESANETLEARVSERTQALAMAKEQAERADLAKSRFLAAASHDLQQPLHAARLFIAALMEDLKAVPERVLLAANADRAIGSADRMLRALLNLSQLDAGGIKPLMRSVFIHDLFAELYREFAQMAERKGLRLRIAPSTAWIVSDPDLLRSMLQNLVINAIRYTDRGGVLVGCRRHGQSVRIEVHDTGRGIADGSLGLIFSEFVRLDRVDDEPGMGLGLAIVDRVAHSLGHGLTVRSTLRRGSIFSVTAERSRPPEAPVRAKAAPVPALSLTGLRVLCVDDDRAVLQSMAALLSRWGATVTLAASWEECDALNDQVWEVALLDYQIGGTRHGIDLLAHMDHRIGRAAIVTANSGEDMRDRIDSLSAVLLRKPLEAEQLRHFLIDAYHDQLVVDPD